MSRRVRRTSRACGVVGAGRLALLFLLSPSLQAHRTNDPRSALPPTHSECTFPLFLLVGDDLPNLPFLRSSSSCNARRSTLISSLLARTFSRTQSAPGSHVRPAFLPLPLSFTSLTRITLRSASSPTTPPPPPPIRRPNHRLRQMSCAVSSPASARERGRGGWRRISGRHGFGGFGEMRKGLWVTDT